MCTLGAKKINGRFFLFKNMDREFFVDMKVKKEKGRAKKLLLVSQRWHCEGLNEHGIGLIEATLQPFPRTKHRTISQLARRVLDQDNIHDAIDVIKNNKTSCNAIISDGDKAFIVEKTPYEFATTQLRGQGVITNLSIKLNKKNGSKLKCVRDWARARYKRGKKIIKNVKSIPDIAAFLSDKKGWPDKSICSGGDWWIPTQHSYIYDLKNKKILFCKGKPAKGKFKEYLL